MGKHCSFKRGSTLTLQGASDLLPNSLSNMGKLWMLKAILKMFSACTPLTQYHKVLKEEGNAPEQQFTAWSRSSPGASQKEILGVGTCRKWAVCTWFYAAWNANVCEFKAVLWTALLKGNHLHLIFIKGVEVKRETLTLLSHSSQWPHARGVNFPCVSIEKLVRILRNELKTIKMGCSRNTTEVSLMQSGWLESKTVRYSL